MNKKRRGYSPSSVKFKTLIQFINVLNLIERNEYKSIVQIMQVYWKKPHKYSVKWDVYYKNCLHVVGAYYYDTIITHFMISWYVFIHVCIIYVYIYADGMK